MYAPAIRAILKGKSESLDWYFAASKPQQTDTAEISEIATFIAGLTELIEGQNFGLVARLMAPKSVELMKTATLTAFVRVTFSFRDVLPGYRKFVDKVTQVVEKRGKDPQRLLKGIL